MLSIQRIECYIGLHARYEHTCYLDTLLSDISPAIYLRRRLRIHTACGLRTSGVLRQRLSSIYRRVLRRLAGYGLDLNDTRLLVVNKGFLRHHRGPFSSAAYWLTLPISPLWSHSRDVTATVLSDYAVQFIS